MAVGVSRSLKIQRNDRITDGTISDSQCQSQYGHKRFEENSVSKYRDTDYHAEEQVCSFASPLSPPSPQVLTLSGSFPLSSSYRDIIYWNDNATLDDYAIDEGTEVLIILTPVPVETGVSYSGLRY